MHAASLPSAVALSLAAMTCLNAGTTTPVAASLAGTYGDGGSLEGAADPAAADFVVIGGGTAGCVVAARLCEYLPEASIVVLERGAPRNETQELQVRSLRLPVDAVDDPDIGETILTEPNPGYGGRRIQQVQGHTLGGSSSINGAQWTKPDLATFDTEAWAFTGLDSATAGDLYRRVERQLQVAMPPLELQQTFLPQYLAAAAAVGIPTVSDPLARSGRPTDGVWPNVLAGDSAGRRVDSCTGYLSPVIAAGGACMRNLQLVQPATVSKVVIEGGRAVGVRYLKTDAPEGQQEGEVAARREVISAAGPYWSPKLLQISGIGPAAVLSELGVEQVVDLPVGENTLARPGAIMFDVYPEERLVPEANASLVNSPASLEAFRAGAPSILGVALTGANGVIVGSNSYISGLNLPLPGLPPNVVVTLCGINPTARGFVRANTTDPRQSPIIHSNFLGNAGDLASAIACSEVAQSLQEEIDPAVGLTNVLPGPAFNNTVSAASVAATAATFYHSVSGCALGAVVDGDFRVVGVDGLRVVDASVLPEMPPFAGPMSTVYMLAELAAETIAATYAE